jgi:hypothetical protein
VLPGTNQQQFLPLNANEAINLKAHYNNLAISSDKINELRNEKGGAGHVKLSQFMKLKEESEKEIYLIWQKILKERFKTPNAELLSHIENKLKYPNLSHYEGRIKAMQDSITKALTGGEPETVIDNRSKIPDPEAMVTVTSESGAEIQPVIKDSGNTIDVGSKQIKAQVRPNNDNSPDVNVNNNNNNVNKKSQVQTIPSAYDPTISTKLTK